MRIGSISVRRNGFWCATAPAPRSVASVKLDGYYWRRHARQPVEFAKSVRTLADLSCKVLLEIGPQPVLTAAALRAWPDPATAPRAIASLRQNTADHRQITEALADAYVAGTPARLRRCRRAGAKARPADLSVRASPVLVYKTTGSRPSQRTVRRRTEAVRLLEDGRIEELAALLDGASGNQQTVDVLTQACRTTQPTTRHSVDRGGPLRDPLGEIHCRRDLGASWRADLPGCSSAMMPTWFSLWSTRWPRAGTSIGFSDCRCRTRTRNSLEVALRAAVADEPTLHILHVAALDRPDDTAPSMRVAGAHATPTSWAEPGGSSAPRLPLNCAGQSG